VSNQQERPRLPFEIREAVVAVCGRCFWLKEVFVPPVANDFGSAIGTAIDVQFRFTGNPMIDWDVYSGLSFRADGSFNSRKI
jgi:hypothetical protein